MKWETEKYETKLDQVSEDGRWHLSVTTSGNQNQCYLSNYDVLTGPGALGSSFADCLQKFIKNCDSYARKLALLKAEAERLLTAEGEGTSC